MVIIGWIFFVLGLLLGLIIIPFGLAGTFLIVVDVFIFALLTDFRPITGSFLAVLLALSIFVELIEFFLGAAVAKKYGSSKWGMFGAVIGGILGAIWATPVFPFFGTIIGAFIGVFLGAFFLEFFRFSDMNKALKAGWGAFLGAITGRFLKLIVAVTMVIAIIAKIW